MSDDAPRLVVVGGPNGCGKTTFARAYAKQENTRYLAADDLAARQSPENPQAARVAAGRAFGRELREALTAGAPLVIESTLSGGSLAGYVKLAQTQGYAITFVMVFLDSPELCLRRIAERVAQGGHDVPEADVRRRFHRALRRFWQTYRHLADDWLLICNGGEAFSRVAGGDPDSVTVYDQDVWERFHAGVAAVAEEENDVEQSDGDGRAGSKDPSDR